MIYILYIIIYIHIYITTSYQLSTGWCLETSHKPIYWTILSPNTKLPLGSWAVQGIHWEHGPSLSRLRTVERKVSWLSMDFKVVCFFFVQWRATFSEQCSRILVWWEAFNSLDFTMAFLIAGSYFPDFFRAFPSFLNDESRRNHGNVEFFNTPGHQYSLHTCSF